VTSQPGWHPDPVPPQPGQPAQLRYWDGTRWTEHTSPAQALAAGEADAAPAYEGVYGMAPSQPGQESYPAYPSYPSYPSYPAAPGGVYGGAPTTPDGVPLAGWWWRVLAVIIDGIFLGVILAILSFPWFRDVFESYRDWFDEAMDSGSSNPDTSQLQSDIAGPLAIISLISLALGFLYNVGFLMWKQATPGKLVLGLRVRLRERPGPMPIGTVLLRWVGQYGVGLLSLVPLAGCLTFVYTLLDYLWPLWDDKKQAIHDKIAKTNVVRVR
jgi:uncharacterized RDD family membrane protein YckC